MWTSQQRGVLLAIVVLLLGSLTWRYLANPIYIGNPLPPEPPRGDELADRLDPNTASAAELTALPSVGEKLSREIVAYREQFQGDHPDELAFARDDDLLKVKGIGPATLAKLKPYLIFPAEAPTQP